MSSEEEAMRQAQAQAFYEAITEAMIDCADAQTQPNRGAIAAALAIALGQLIAQAHKDTRSLLRQNIDEVISVVAAREAGLTRGPLGRRH